MSFSSMIVDPLAHLRDFYGKIDEFEEMPHSFDDTLIDKLIDHLNLDADGFSTFIAEEMSRNDLDEQSSIPLTITVRLIDKALRENCSLSHSKLSQFLTMSIILLQQERPLILWSALLKLYRVAHSIVNEYDWKEVISWIIAVLPKENLSVFVRRDAEKFLSLFSGPETDRIVPSLVEIFLHNDSSLVRDSVARLLTAFHSLVSVSDALSLMAVIQKLKSAGHSVCDLAATLCSDMTLQRSLVLEEWASETVRLSVAVIWIRNHAMCDSSLKSSLLSSRFLTLSHVSVIGQFMTKEEFLALLSTWPVFDRRRSPSSDIQRMFSLGRQLECSLEELKEYVEKSLEKALDEPLLVKSLVDVFSLPSIISHRELSHSLRLLIETGINSDLWEHVDSALEMALLFPRELSSFLPPCVFTRLHSFSTHNLSPYVRAVALKAMHHFGIDGTAKLAYERATKDADPQPRLEALVILHSLIPTCSLIDSQLIEKVLDDCDLDVRRRMVSICEDLLNGNENRQVSDELEKWIDDVEIGPQVRKILSIPSSTVLNATDRVLCEMLSAIEINKNEDDTIDCY